MTDRVGLLGGRKHDDRLLDEVVEVAGALAEPLSLICSYPVPA